MTDENNQIIEHIEPVGQPPETAIHDGVDERETLFSINSDDAPQAEDVGQGQAPAAKDAPQVENVGRGLAARLSDFISRLSRIFNKVFFGIRIRIIFADPPKWFRGIPISLVTAGLIIMAFAGFWGLKIT